MAFARAHALVAVTPDDPAYEIKPSNWNADHALSGADVGGIPYCPTATTETTSANLTYTETSGPRLQVGSGTGTSAGWVLGYSGATGNAILWNTNGGDTNTAFTLKSDGNSTYLNAPASTLALRTANTTKLSILITAGYGASITAGTATTDVQALSATQTVNAAGVAFKSFKYSVTYTASAAGTLHSEWNGGAAGATQLMAITKEGALAHIGIAFGSLPTGVAGMVAYITDSSTATWGATIAGSGANKVLGWFNGTNWTVAGA